MKITTKNTQIFQASYLNKGKQIMQNMTDSSTDFINSFIKELTNAKGHKEALDILFSNVENGNLQEKNGVLFKHGEYYIQNLFKLTGMPYKNILEQLSKTKTTIAPELIKTIEKDSEMFIISKIKGTKTGDLIPLYKVHDQIPKENLLNAFKDLQKITKAGIADNKILHSPNLWFVTPDDMRIVLPEWGQTRPILPSEGKDILNQYYNFLFRK